MVVPNDVIDHLNGIDGVLRVIIMDSDHIVLSAIQPETVAGRLGAREAAEAAEEEGED